MLLKRSTLEAKNGPAAEHSEYEALIHSGKLMSILRLKAGVFLQNLKAA
jgi:hypothetical protein